MGIHFDYPWAAFAAAAMPVFVFVTFWLWHRRRLERLSRLGGEVAIARLAPAAVRRMPTARALRMAAILALATLAFAGPRWGATTSVVRATGLDVAIAM